MILVSLAYSSNHLCFLKPYKQDIEFYRLAAIFYYELDTQRVLQNQP